MEKKMEELIVFGGWMLVICPITVWSSLFIPWLELNLLGFTLIIGLCCVAFFLWLVLTQIFFMAIEKRTHITDINGQGN